MVGDLKFQKGKCIRYRRKFWSFGREIFSGMEKYRELPPKKGDITHMVQDNQFKIPTWHPLLLRHVLELFSVFPYQSSQTLCPWPLPLAHLCCWKENIQDYKRIHKHVYSVSVWLTALHFVYSQTCIKRPPKGSLKSGLLIQVVS